ncbi:MAG: nicotinic acid mononucleotide adenylyltransferase, partial [Mesorhizobium sp.]
MPHAEKGLAVGLFGGSFNPPHAGHALVAEIALRRLALDQLWWMVTPGNPLKNTRELAPLGERLQLSEQIAKNPKIKVTAFEAAHHVRYTADTLALVKARNPG